MVVHKMISYDCIEDVAHFVNQAPKCFPASEIDKTIKVDFFLVLNRKIPIGQIITFTQFEIKRKVPFDPNL